MDELFFMDCQNVQNNSMPNIDKLGETEDCAAVKKYYHVCIKIYLFLCCAYFQLWLFSLYIVFWFLYLNIELMNVRQTISQVIKHTYEIQLCSRWSSST